MGDRQGIRRFLGSFFLRLTTGLVVISTGDMRCLFDVLGGDLVANPTEFLRQVTALHRRKSRWPPMCGTPCFPRTASDSDMIFDDLDFTWFSHFGISSFRCLNTPQNNRPVNLSAHDKTKDENKTCGLVSCFTRLFDSVINKHRAKRQVSRTTKKLLNLSNSASKALSVSP